MLSGVLVESCGEATTQIPGVLEPGHIICSRDAYAFLWDADAACPGGVGLLPWESARLCSQNYPQGAGFCQIRQLVRSADAAAGQDGVPSSSGTEQRRTRWQEGAAWASNQTPCIHLLPLPLLTPVADWDEMRLLRDQSTGEDEASAWNLDVLPDFDGKWTCASIATWDQEDSDPWGMGWGNTTKSANATQPAEALRVTGI